jgi:hypothetical protein
VAEVALLDGLDRLAATRRLLFLDVDGVLNSQATRVGGRDSGEGWDAPQPAMLASLAWVVERTAAEIVVSSTWRLEERKHSQLKAALAATGLQTGGVTDDLSRTMRHDRPDEICEWLLAATGSAAELWAAGRPARGQRQTQAEAEPVVPNAWIAVDDMDMTLMNPARMPATNFVRTDDRVGLVPAKAVEAVGKLLAGAVSRLPGLPVMAPDY